MLNKDLSPVLRDWEYDPSSISARTITGNDGRLKVQLRLDLGIFQMEVAGRPDGTCPRGYPSLLEYYLTLERTSPPGTSALQLDDNAFAELQQEAVQYYYRYLCFYALKDLDRVIQDTKHNLKIFEFVSRHADNEDIAWQFLQFYPEVSTMHTRASAEKAARDQHFDLAARVIKQGLADVRSFWKHQGEEEFDEEYSHEEELLTELLEEIENQRPKSKSDYLREALDRAIATEDYEKAAALRDELLNLEQQGARTSAG